MLWSVVSKDSKAANKSKRVSRETFPATKERRSLTIFRSAVSVQIDRQTDSNCTGCLNRDVQRAEKEPVFFLMILETNGREW